MAQDNDNAHDDTDDTAASTRRRWLLPVLGVLTIFVALIIAFVIITARSTSQLEEEQQAIEESLQQEQEQSEPSETLIPGMTEPVPVPGQQDAEEDETEEQEVVERGRGVYGDDPLSGSSPEEVIGSAREFASVFIETEFTSTEQMRAEVEPFLTDALREKFQTVEYYNVPIHTLDGRATVFSQGTSDALVDVEFAGSGFMRVYLVLENGQWKVSDYGIR